MEITVVYVVGKRVEDCALVIYADDKRIYYHAPLPERGSDMENLITAITGKEPNVIHVKQTGGEYPVLLSDMETWPQG